MKRRPPSRPRGVAAIELALILCLTQALIPLLLLFGRVLWHYHVLKHAADEAALAVARQSLLEMQNGNSAALAYRLASDAADHARLEHLPGISYVPVSCSSGPAHTCTGIAGGTVTVSVVSHVTMSAFRPLIARYMDNGGRTLNLVVASTVPYVNRPLNQ
jgi:Flp pilus assembly protein TadG